MRYNDVVNKYTHTSQFLCARIKYARPLDPWSSREYMCSTILNVGKRRTERTNEGTNERTTNQRTNDERDGGTLQVPPCFRNHPFFEDDNGGTTMQNVCSAYMSLHSGGAALVLRLTFDLAFVYLTPKTIPCFVRLARHSDRWADRMSCARNQRSCR